jgi:hypothetical protein
VEEGFWQFDWSRAKVCLVSLHTRGYGQWMMPSKMLIYGLFETVMVLAVG